MATQVAVIRATLKYKTQDEMIRGMSPHISKRGLIIHTRQTREVGSTVQFEFKLADGSQSYTGEGIVRDILDGTKPGMLIALKRVNPAFKEVVDAILSKAEKPETSGTFSQHIVQGSAVGDFLGDLDLDSGLDSLFSSIEKAPNERRSDAVNGIFSGQFDISEPIESQSLSFEIGENRDVASADERGEINVDEFEQALNSLSGTAAKASDVATEAKPSESAKEERKDEWKETLPKETEQYFAIKREDKSVVDTADEELKAIESQTQKPALSKSAESEKARSTTLTGFPIEEESSADLFAALQNEIFAMESTDNPVIPESMLSQPEKSPEASSSPVIHAATTSSSPVIHASSPVSSPVNHAAPLPVASNNSGSGISPLPKLEQAEVKRVSNPLLNRPSVSATNPVSLDELISQTSADALEKDSVKPAAPKPILRKNSEDNKASLDALLKRADIKSKNVVLTDVNTRKATPRKRNSADDGEPSIPMPKKGGFLSNLFKK